MNDPLQAYREKRDFSKSGEPAGGERPSSQQPIFVIHQHDAMSLQHDEATFRK